MTKEEELVRHFASFNKKIAELESENEMLNQESKEIIRKLISAETRIVQLEKENERLKAEREWISTKDNPPKNRQNILAWEQETNMGWIVPLCWNIHAFTHEEFPYYMVEPQPPKQ